METARGAFWDNPYGGMLDFNHDGKENLSEQWLALKIFEQAAKIEEPHNDYFSLHRNPRNIWSILPDGMREFFHIVNRSNNK